MKKRSFCFVFTGFILFVVVISTLNLDHQQNFQYKTGGLEEQPLSSSLEGAENILVTELRRNGTLSGYGMVNLIDKITILNQNDNPINCFYFGVPLRHSDDLIFYKATGANGETLLTERDNMVINEFEMIIIYFDTPLLPNQETTIWFYQTFKNLFTYNIFNDPFQVHHNFTFTIWPVIPYRAEGEIHAQFKMPSTAERLYFERIGSTGNEAEGGFYLYDLSKSFKYDHLDPFLANLEDAIDSKNGKEYITILFQDTVLKFAELHVEEINREIHISPWGLIKVKENVIIQNHGYYDQRTVSFKVHKSAMNIKIYDDLGALSGTLGDDIDENNRRDVEVNLVQNRALLTPSSKISFTIEYDLRFEDYVSLNWLQQSIELDLLTTQYEYLEKDLTINLIIEGCGNIEFISSPPNAIEQNGGAKTISFNSDYAGSQQEQLILVTYTIDLFDLLLRPILIMLALTILLSAFVLITKTKKTDEKVSVFKKEFLPTNEIREFCSLYEEMNALVLEIRKAEDETKRKKIAKKTYKNILTKNTTKIDQIKEEIAPFKKILIETSETFENIVKKLEVLDAERTSVNDSLTLLENRYKRGRLPSKQAYEKLSNDFLNRMKKIDRTIDRFIQQLRSYLL